MSVMLSISESDAILLQKKLSTKVITKNILPKKIKRVCGVDVSYRADFAHCNAVILDKNKMSIIESKTTKLKSATRYIPGLFMLKESKPILHTLKKLTKSFDLLLVDGNGQLHPRQCGLACYIGLKLNKPVIGVAKSLLCGIVREDSKVEYNEKVLGSEIRHGKKKIYVSIGHKISLRTAEKIVRELTINKNWYPEPLRLADFNSKSIS